MNVARILWVIAVLVILTVVFRPHPALKSATVRVGTAVVTVDIASTNAEQSRGLSGRETLAADAGMLFVFREPAVLQFWMKDMRFPLDIIWIGPHKTVVGVSERLESSSYPSLFAPPEPALYVLEVNAGFASAHGIKIGDAVTVSE